MAVFERFVSAGVHTVDNDSGTGIGAAENDERMCKNRQQPNGLICPTL